jgi:hypothetical protein
LQSGIRVKNSTVPDSVIIYEGLYPHLNSFGCTMCRAAFNPCCGHHLEKYRCGDWSTATNWNPNQVPDASDTAVIATNGTMTASDIIGLNPQRFHCLVWLQ